MRDACIRAVNAAMRRTHGRDATPAELRNIEARIQRHRREMAREDNASYRAMSQIDQLAEAGRRAAREIASETDKKVERAEASILTHDDNVNYQDAQVAKGADTDAINATERLLVHKYDEKGGEVTSVEENANGTTEAAMAEIADVFETVNPGLWERIQRGITSIEPMRKAWTDALHGVTAGVPPEFVRAAKAYHDVVDALRERFNAAGGVIGRLEDWGISHIWSARLLLRYEGYDADMREVAGYRATGRFQQADALAKAMEGRARDAFAQNMMRWADRSRYVHDDGSYFSDDDMRKFFEEAWATIVSGGWTKEQAPGFLGGAVKANRGSQHRVIHLMPEANYHALDLYSDQNALETMVGGIRRMSRDIALIEAFGPNADHQFAALLNRATTEAARSRPGMTAHFERKAERLQNLYDMIAGNEPKPASRAVSDAFATNRNLQIASKLLSAVVSSIGDFPSLYVTAMGNKLNPFKVMMNSNLAWSGSSRRYARRMGLILDTLIADMDRFSAENLTSKALSARTASTLIRASGLTFVTNARRLGFAMTLMDSIGHLTRRFADVTALGANDLRILASKGIDQATWDIWRAADLDKHRGNDTLLTPENIMKVQGVPVEARRSAVIKLLSIVRQEQDLAVINPGVRERWQLQQLIGNPRSGTVLGELWRSVILFKTFPWALLERHLARAQFYGGNKYAYLAAMFVSMTLCGQLTNWLNDLRRGRDPRTVNVFSGDPHTRSIAWRNVINSMLKGGALGVYGDFLFSETSPTSGGGLAETLMGPTGGLISQTLGLTVGNAVQAIQGEDTHFAKELLRYTRSNTPGSNLVWTQTLTDRYIWDMLADLAEPGSNERLRQRQQQREGTTYWWEPGDTVPERAPDLGAAVR
jgi:hypothetical protein